VLDGPKIAAVCITWDRPKLLGQMLRMFELQTYPNRELVILDNAGQYGHQQGDRWRLWSERRSYTSLGAKRNDAARLISSDTEAIAVWDDDDTYLPWALEACAFALTKGQYCQPRAVWDEWNVGEFILTETYNRRQPTKNFSYHAAWAWRVEAFWATGGYPTSHPGDYDTAVADRLYQLYGPSIDSLCPEYPVPYYIYARHGDNAARKLSGDDRARIAKMSVQPARAVLVPTWPETYTQFLAPKPPAPRLWEG